jgi:hypothetical protein
LDVDKDGTISKGDLINMRKYPLHPSNLESFMEVDAKVI